MLLWFWHDSYLVKTYVIQLPSIKEGKLADCESQDF